LWIRLKMIKAKIFTPALLELLTKFRKLSREIMTTSTRPSAMTSAVRRTSINIEASPTISPFVTFPRRISRPSSPVVQIVTSPSRMPQRNVLVSSWAMIFSLSAYSWNSQDAKSTSLSSFERFVKICRFFSFPMRSVFDRSNFLIAHPL
jgi:hypothetical protein